VLLDYGSQEKHQPKSLASENFTASQKFFSLEKNSDDMR